MIVSVNVDPDDVLDEMDDEDIYEYLVKKNYFQPKSFLEEDIVEGFFDGTFDIKSFFDKVGDIGREQIHKILDSFDKPL